MNRFEETRRTGRLPASQPTHSFFYKSENDEVKRVARVEESSLFTLLHNISALCKMGLGSDVEVPLLDKS